MSVQVLGGREVNPVACSGDNVSHRKFYLDLSDGTRVFTAFRCGDQAGVSKENLRRVVTGGREVESETCTGCHSDDHRRFEAILNDGSTVVVDTLCGASQKPIRSPMPTEWPTFSHNNPRKYLG